MIPCLSEVTTLPATFSEDVSGYSDGGCTTMEVWLTKLETHLEKHSVESTRQLLSERGMTLPVAAYQGGLLLSEGPARKAAFDLYRKRLELCQMFGIGTMLLVADFRTPLDVQNLGRAVASLAEAGKWAAGFGVRIALEFRGTDTFCTSLDTALALVMQTNEPNVGVCLDLFHYYKGPSKTEDLGALSASNLFHVQVCDVPGIPRELMADSDRVLPGEGDFQHEPILQVLRKMNYTGCVSVELMNQTVWKSKPHQVAEIAMASLKRLLS
jgi:2-keto-myo-inositol isomerase